MLDHHRNLTARTVRLRARRARAHVLDRRREPGAVDAEHRLVLAGEGAVVGVLSDRRGAHRERLAEARRDRVAVVEPCARREDDGRRHRQPELDEARETRRLAAGLLEGRVS